MKAPRSPRSALPREQSRDLARDPPHEAPRPSGRRASAAVATTLDQPVYDALFDALMHGELKPGVRLAELALCERFSVSRTVVRQALRRLAELQIIEIVPNKGATVAAPTPRETREVFAARRAIEAAIIAEVARRIGHSEIERLRQRLRAEHEALQGDDHSRWVALAGGFHLTLAEMSGNRVLQRLLTELLTRCSLIVATYEVRGESTCEHDEHAALVECLVLRDVAGAQALMEKHLLDLEARLKLPAAPDATR